MTKSVPREAKKAALSPGVTRIPQPDRAASPAEDLDGTEAEEPDATEEPEAPEADRLTVPDKTEAELRAEVSDAQVKRYWKAVEAQRKAPRVHQEDLDVSDKVLRYFDVSSQYGVSRRPRAPSLVSCPTLD